MSLRPDLTVAAVVERDGQFLLVEERADNRMVFNQPAGHVEAGEQLIQAVIRETLEETAWVFRPEALTGIYLWEKPATQRSFLRFTFCGSVHSHDPERRLDRGIHRALWMDRAELVKRATRLRSPMVLQCIDDYLAGRRYDLGAVTHLMRDPAALASIDRRSLLSDAPAVERIS